MNFCSAGVFTFCFMPVEGQCFMNIWRLMFGMCVVSGKIADCNLEHWLLKQVLA